MIEAQKRVYEETISRAHAYERLDEERKCIRYSHTSSVSVRNNGQASIFHVHIDRSCVKSIINSLIGFLIY